MKENVLMFKKYWPSSMGVKAFGANILFKLHTYNWDTSVDSWQPIENNFCEYLAVELKKLSPELASECLSVLKLYLNSCYSNPPGKHSTINWLDIRYTKYSTNYRKLLKALDNIGKSLSLSSDSYLRYIKKVQYIPTLLFDTLKLSGSYITSNPMKSLVVMLASQIIVSEAQFNPFKTIKKAAEGVGKVAEGVVKGAESLGKGDVVRAIEHTAGGIYYGAIEAISGADASIPDLVKHISNEFNVVFDPIPGHKCGPDDVKPIAWLVPDYIQFTTAQIDVAKSCEKHDACYDKCRAKEDCDKEFGGNVQEECKAKLTGAARDVCLKLADVYELGVTKGGKSSYIKSCGKSVDSEEEVYLLNSISQKYLFLSDDKLGIPPDNVVEARKEKLSDGRSLFRLKRTNSNNL